jgi:hypothetical protein
MKVSYVGSALIILLAFPILLGAQAFPRMMTVDPMTAKIGDVVTVSGENLDKENVAEVFLTDGKSDTRVQITEQAAASIKFKVPDEAKPGRFGLVIRTPSSPPKDYVQPVKVTVQ